MKYTLKLVLLFSALFLISCFNQNNKIEKKIEEKINDKREDSTIHIKTTSYEKNIESNNNHDEYISNSLFEKWKGIYKLKQDYQLDGWGRESISFSELILIEPDSCVFKNWLADEDGKRYSENDNYQEFIGGILATPNKDSIEFYAKRVVSGGNNSLSPLLTLTRNKKNHFIYCLITSPSNNGIVKMHIEKLNSDEESSR
ncbi:MAG: hypothetical protein LBE36_01740 [Flavobacteriaceae bacterium]|jgi:hypothetical protein|nr:hypothetical protein [Flavobacteriaceae bacterium]